MFINIQRAGKQLSLTLLQTKKSQLKYTKVCHNSDRQTVRGFISCRGWAWEMLSLSPAILAAKRRQAQTECYRMYRLQNYWGAGLCACGERWQALGRKVVELTLLSGSWKVRGAESPQRASGRSTILDPADVLIRAGLSITTHVSALSRQKWLFESSCSHFPSLCCLIATILSKSKTLQKQCSIKCLIWKINLKKINIQIKHCSSLF